MLCRNDSFWIPGAPFRFTINFRNFPFFEGFIALIGNRALLSIILACHYYFGKFKKWRPLFVYVFSWCYLSADAYHAPHSILHPPPPLHFLLPRENRKKTIYPIAYISRSIYTRAYINPRAGRLILKDCT